MPRGNGKAYFTGERVADRNFALSKRSPERSSCMFPLKENPVLLHILRSSEQRPVVITFHTPDLHFWRSLAPFTSSSQGPGLKDGQDSVNKINADMPDNLNPDHSLRAILYHFDLPKEKSAMAAEKPALSPSSAKMITDCRSSPHRLKQKRSCKTGPSNSLATSTAPMESIRPVDGDDLIDLDIFADNTAQLENPSKRSSRKKGKKKRKQHKRSMRKNSFSNTENQGEEVISYASVSEASVIAGPACSTVGACQSLLAQDASDVAMEKLDLDSNAEVCLGRSSSSVSEAWDENINDSAKLISPSSKFDDTSLDQVSIEDVSSCSNPSLENTSEIGSGKGSPDCCEVQCSITNDGFNPLADSNILTSGNAFDKGEELYPIQENNMSNICSVKSSYWPENATETECSTERDLCSSQASTSDDFHPVIRTKRGRISRTFSGSSGGMNNFSKFSLRGGSESENKRPQWQKIPKNITAELPSRRNDKNITLKLFGLSESGAQTWVGPKKVGAVKENRIENNRSSYSTKRDAFPSYSSPATPVSIANSGQLPSSDADDRSTCIYSENLKRKTDSTTEQESYHFLNACHPRKSIINKGLETTAMCTGISQKTKTIDLSSRTNQDSQSATLQPEIMPENNFSIVQEVSVSSSVTKSDLVRNEAEYSHGNTQSSKDMNNNVQINNEGEQFCSLGDGSAHLEIGNNNSNSGHQSPKWRNDMIIDENQNKNLTDFVVLDTVLNSPHSSITDEVPSPVSLDRSSLSSTDGLQALCPTSRYMVCPSPEEVKLTSQLDCQLCTSSETSCGLSHPSTCPLCQEAKEKKFQGFETDLFKIVDAVTGSYKLVMSSEEAHCANGRPLAQIERVLNCASPVLETACTRGFRACSQNQNILNTTCVHQLPTVSLQRVWQWYEKPGSYGLEVKLEELHASKRSLNGLSEFCAYFAPYLSAVQLFSRSQKTFNRHVNVAEGEMLRNCVDSPSTFSELPQEDCKEADTTRNEHLDDGVLLFEYFDSDQPQQRRPLFNKIKELVRGYSSSNGHFGDPSMLETLNLEELHPASWYAVAWYPIYRIPDGTFRAAFLTYHSFDQFICRKMPDNGNNGSVHSLISPVIGLQSYNAKGEWFEPTSSSYSSRASQADSSVSWSPSEILRERLQSLEKAANVMSRASVLKGGQKRTNIHPDYEFFLSRKW